MMKKLIACLLSLTIAATMMAGCAQQTTDTDSISKESAETTKADTTEEKVIVFNGPDEWVRSQLQTEKGGYESVVAKFEAENPSVKVKLTSEPWGTWGQKLPVVIASGDAPDVFMLNSKDAAAFYNGGYTIDLSDMDAEFLGKFYPGVLAAHEDNGVIMALPFTTDCRVLWYNKEIFKQAGITEPPKTWTELVDYAKKCAAVTIDGQKVYGFGLDLGLKEVPAASLLCASDAMFFDKETKQPTVDNDTMRQYMQALIDMRDTYEPDFATLNHENVATLFGQKKVGMVIAGAWVWSVNEGLDQEDWYGMAPIPKQTESSPDGSFAGGWAMGVSSKSKYPEEAKKFLQMLYDEDIAYKLSTDVPPLVGADEKCALFQNPKAEVFVKQMSTGRQLMPPSTVYPEIESMIWEYLSKAISEKLTIDETIAGIESDMIEILG